MCYTFLLDAWKHSGAGHAHGVIRREVVAEIFPFEVDSERSCCDGVASTLRREANVCGVVIQPNGGVPTCWDIHDIERMAEDDLPGVVIIDPDSSTNVLRLHRDVANCDR